MSQRPRDESHRQKNEDQIRLPRPHKLCDELVKPVNEEAADDYSEWLLSQRGTVAPNIDLEF
jgi:hypothetical protein